MTMCFDGDSMVALVTTGSSAGSPAVPAESIVVETIHALIGNPVLTSLEIIIGQGFMRADPQATGPPKTLALGRVLY